MRCKGDTVDFFPHFEFRWGYRMFWRGLFFFFFLVFLGEWLIFGPVPRPLDVYVLNAYGSFPSYSIQCDNCNWVRLLRCRVGRKPSCKASLRPLALSLRAMLDRVEYGPSVEWYKHGRTEETWVRPGSVSLCPQQNLHGLALDRTWVSAVRSRPTARARKPAANVTCFAGWFSRAAFLSLCYKKLWAVFAVTHVCYLLQLPSSPVICRTLGTSTAKLLTMQSQNYNTLVWLDTRQGWKCS